LLYNMTLVYLSESSSQFFHLYELSFSVVRAFRQFSDKTSWSGF
jgi:hypothetical protein